MVCKRRGGSVNNSPQSCHTSPSASDTSDHLTNQKPGKGPDPKRKRVQTQRKTEILENAKPETLVNVKIENLENAKPEYSEELGSKTLVKPKPDVNLCDDHEVEKRESRRGRHKCKFCNFYGSKEGIVLHIQGRLRLRDIK